MYAEEDFEKNLRNNGITCFTQQMNLRSHLWIHFPYRSSDKTKLIIEGYPDKLLSKLQIYL